MAGVAAGVMAWQDVAAMPPDRLTRQELSWLLAQEARGAARTLRAEVTQLKQPVITEVEPGSEVETTLDTLDDAIEMLTALQAGPALAGRRGRIDIAALLCSIAPNARVALEPGAGTEVFGEENELRRMLHVLLSQTHSNPSEAVESASQEVSIRREDDWIRISVDLGPDSSVPAELERRWLSRMATRHGGRLELEGGTQSVVLPAEGASDRREVFELRKELEQAQQLGEAYARELATALATSSELPPPHATPAPAAQSELFETVTGLAAGMTRTLRELSDGLRADAAHLSAIGGAPNPLAQNLERRAQAAGELFAELARIAQCRSDEPAQVVHLGALLERVGGALERRAYRHGVKLTLAPTKLSSIQTQAAVLELLVAEIASYAVLATPRGGEVCLRAEQTPQGLHVVARDGGPVIPASVREDVLKYRVDPSAHGRPGGISLLVAYAAAKQLGGLLSIDEHQGQSEVSVLLPAPAAQK